MIFTFILSLSLLVLITTKSSARPASLPCMLQVHIYVRHLGSSILSMVHDSAQIVFKQENKEQSAIHVVAECKMNKKMPGLSTSCKTIII